MTRLLQWIRGAGLALLVATVGLASPAAAGTTVSPQGLTNATTKGATTATGTAGTLTDGPSVTVGAVGTWLVTGTATVVDSAVAATFNCEVWDGTTVASAAAANTTGAAADASIAMVGIGTNPAGGILKLSCKDNTAGTGSMLGTGSGAPTQITAVRIG